MKKQLLTLAFVLFTIFFSYGQTAYQDALKEMFEVSGSEEVYKGVIDQMFEMYKAQKTEVPQHVWDELKEEMLKSSINELTEQLEPVYKKYFTITDIEELTAFYNTPVGKKYAKYAPQIMSESMEAGKKWGYKIGMNFEKKLQDRGY